MEGLIPFVYRTIKRSVAHRHYKCLSTTGGADFYLHGFNEGADHFGRTNYYLTPQTQSSIPDHGLGRCNSSMSRVGYGDDNLGGFHDNLGGDYTDHPTQKRQMVRFRSQRRFSCIPGF